MSGAVASIDAERPLSVTPSTAPIDVDGVTDGM